MSYGKKQICQKQLSWALWKVSSLYHSRPFDHTFLGKSVEDKEDWAYECRFMQQW